MGRFLRAANIILFIFCVSSKAWAQSNQSVSNGGSTTPVNFQGAGCTYNWVNSTPGIGLPSSGTGNIPAFTAINNGNTPIVATITATPLLSGFAYIPNSSSGNVSVINLSNNLVIATIPTNTTPLGVSVSSDGTLVYITNQGSQNISVINTASNSVIAIIPVASGAYPSGVVVSPDGLWVYTANFENNTVSVISTTINAVVSTVNVGTYPYSLAISPDGKQLYVPNAGDNTISIINTAARAVVSTISVGAGPNAACVSPDGSTVYVANYNSNNVSVISTLTNSVINTIPAGSGAGNAALSPDGGTLYVTNINDNTVSVVNTLTNNVVSTIAVGIHPAGLSVSPDGSRLYVTSINGNNVSVINTTTNQITGTIAVGLGPLAIGNFITGGTGCAPVTFTIKVNPAITNITATGTLSALTTIYGTPSPSTNFTVSGTNMAAGILVTPPAGFEVSTDNITFSSTVILGATGTIAPATVYIRLTSTTPVSNNYSGNIVLSSTGVNNVNVAMPVSAVNPALLTITTDNQTKTYGAPNPVLTVSYNGFVNGETPAVLQTQPDISTIATPAFPVGAYPITVSGAGAANYIISFIPGGALTITPAPLVIAANNVNKTYGTTLAGGSNSTAFTATGLQNSETTGSVTIAYGQGSSATDPTGTYTGSIIPSAVTGGTFAAGNYTITYVAGDIIVGAVSNPVLTAAGALLPLQTIYGTPSSSENFSISGTNLMAVILVTPPIGFEVSTDNITFSNTVTIGSPGNVSSAKVYVRLASKAMVRFYSGNIVLSSGIASYNVIIPNSVVKPAVLTITADNKRKIPGGINPVLTVSYQGFVNNEGPAELIVQPEITTSATTTSSAGNYSINAGGAMSDNYIFNYVPGILTIAPDNVAVNIPNAFTPNGDGANDVWNINALIDYPQCAVSIFTRYGTLIYQSRGYPKPWDGTYNGIQLPTGVYYYVIDLRNNTAPLSGSLTLLR